MSKRLHAKYPLFSSHFNKTRVSSTDFEKSSNIRFYENPSIGSRDVRYGQTYVCTDGQTDRHDEANNRVSNFIRAREMSVRRRNRCAAYSLVRTQIELLSQFLHFLLPKPQANSRTVSAVLQIHIALPETSKQNCGTVKQNLIIKCIYRPAQWS